MPRTQTNGIVAAALLLVLSLAAGANAGVAATPSVTTAESAFERARFLHDRIELTLARGAETSQEGWPLAELRQRFGAERAVAAAALEKARPASAEEEQAVALMREVLAGELALAKDADSSPPTKVDCSGDLVAAAAGGDDPAPLSVRLYDCYGAAASALEIDGETIDRLSLFERLRRESDRDRRRRLFDALAPLGRLIDHDGAADSPFRELVRRTALGWQRDGSPVERQLRALGFEPAEFESALVGFLERWRRLQPETPIEPWDLHYAHAAASRELAAAAPLERLEAINQAFHRRLGADPLALGVRFDLLPRAGKTPVAFSNFGARARTVEGRRLPTEPWIFATYRSGGFDNLVELLHETGHAVHLAAIETRPAFLDWPDADAFTEALAELLALEAYEPEWQARYLGQSVPLEEAIRSKYGAIALDVAWALFEIRIYRDLKPEPNAANRLWSELTSRYLGVVPHPERSWWMLRGQLLGDPGYMVNYSIGALLAADLRARARELRGPFSASGPETYGWLSAELYRWGRERSARAVIEKFLGRRPGVTALLADLARGETPPQQ